MLLIEDPIETLRLRVHTNIMRRKVLGKEKEDWIQDARRLLKDRLERNRRKKIANTLGITSLGL